MSVALASLAAATPLEVRNGSAPTSPTKTITMTVAAPTATSQCNTDQIQCCNQVEPADSGAVKSILGLLGMIIFDVTGLVGLSCSPIGDGGSACSAHPVCCQNNNVGGLISVGCIPINFAT